MRITNFMKSKELARLAHALIPAGCHTYSKGDDQFPEEAPGFIQRGIGCRVWDVDGNEFLDWGMGLRSVILGHAYPRVLDAVREQLQYGSNFTRPAPIELEFAQRVIDLIPSAEMVKFAKNGSDVTSAAVRLARAHTGRDYVALCKENPFFSFYDWFIGTTPADAGIPGAVKDLSLRFSYNDIASLERLFAAYPGQIAAVILEPVSTEVPAQGFLERVRELCTINGTVLIFDEMISGFRWHLRGAQTYFGVTPDLSTFGKAIANGFSVAALVGKREIMELGGIHHSRPRVFLLSATHGAETHSLAAALATIEELEENQVTEHIWRIGRRLVDGINGLAARHGLTDHVSALGYPCSPFVVCCDASNAVSMPFRTLFLQELIAHGVLMPYIAISYAHTDVEVDQTLAAVDAALGVYARALSDGIDKYLVGPAVKPVFRKYN